MIVPGKLAINTVFSAEDNYPQNRKNNFVTFYNDLYIPLNSNFQNPIDKIVAYIAKIAMLPDMPS